MENKKEKTSNSSNTKKDSKRKGMVKINGQDFMKLMDAMKDLLNSMEFIESGRKRG